MTSVGSRRKGEKALSSMYNGISGLTQFWLVRQGVLFVWRDTQGRKPEKKQGLYSCNRFFSSDFWGPFFKSLGDSCVGGF